jgi:hypothetical protein
MKHELKKHALLLAQAIVYPDDVRSRYEATSKDECEMPPETAESQASLAVSDLLDQAMCGMDVRWEAPLTLCAAAQFAADKHGDDAGEQFDYWRKEKPSTDYSAEDIAHNEAYFEAHSAAAERLSKALADAMVRYSADIKHAESL